MEKRAAAGVHPKKAAALQYDPATGAPPRVVAAGGGAVAERIIARARAAGVPVEEDPLLVDCLCRVPLGGEIPPELYQAVAEVLAFVFRLEGEPGRNRPVPGGKLGRQESGEEAAHEAGR